MTQGGEPYKTNKGYVGRILKHYGHEKLTQSKG
jgi:hypothetical protein